MNGDGPRPLPLLSVVVPAWNEAGCIAATLDQLDSELAATGAEVIVVDDGSTDGTATITLGWIARHPRSATRLIATSHRGKGSAVYTGVLASVGAVIAYIDADLDIPAQEIGRLLAARSALAADLVVGSKRGAGGRPLGRTAASICFSWVVALCFRLPVRDTQTGCKILPGPWLRSLARQARVPGYLFDVEILAAAARAGLRVAELPVAAGMRRRSSRMGPRDAVAALRELVAIRWTLRSATCPPPPRQGRTPVPGVGAGLRHSGRILPRQHHRTRGEAVTAHARTDALLARARSS